MVNFENSQMIARVRAELGLTQQELAEALGVHQTTIMRWERGKGPIREVFVQAAKRLLDRGESA